MTIKAWPLILKRVTSIIVINCTIGQRCNCKLCIKFVNDYGN